MILGTGIPGTARTTCRITGSWSSQLGQFCWSGELTATEPFVVLLLARREQHLFWAKSSASEDGSLPLRLFLHPVNSNGRDLQPLFSAGHAIIDGLTVTSRDA